MMTRRQFSIGLGLLVAAGSLAVVTVWLNRAGQTKLVSDNVDESAKAPVTLDQAIAAASDYLVRHCDKQGQFVYRVNLDPNVDVKPEYNVIRHAGTVYALAASHQRRPSPEKLVTLRRATNFLRQQAMGPVPGQSGMLTIWSNPDVEQTEQPLQAKLGGAGLGLVALLSAEQIEPGTVPLEELRGLGRFILFMQKPDGSFYANYYPDRRGRDPRSFSLYYPGEAALGLVMLYEKDPQPIWLQSAARAIAYLARARRGLDEVAADHWALLATARLWPLCDQCSPPLPRETLSRHAVQICRQILNTRYEGSSSAIERGCLTEDGRTCPTATRVEGLTATLTFLPESEAALRDEMRQTVDRAVRFLVESQVRDGPYSGGIPGAISSEAPAKSTPEIARKAHSRTEIRVDYVQHALSAMIQSEKLEGDASDRQARGDATGKPR